LSSPESVTPSLPPRRRLGLSIAIPASLTEDTPHLREKTYKIGLIGRASSIFRVDEILVYSDKPHRDQTEDAELTASVLRYMDTPQYLRKATIKIEPRLRYVGILPPLRSPHHQLTRNRGDLKIGMLRQGVVVKRGGGYSLVDIGLEEPALVQEDLPKKRRVTVLITKVDRRVEAVKVDDAEISIYWGYNVTVTNLPLAESTRKIGFDLVIATSRYGRRIDEVLSELRSAWTESRKTLVAFGSPTQGLQQILSREGLDIDEYTDFNINTIPNQGVETVRTEEAIYTSLSIVNLLG